MIKAFKYLLLALVIATIWAPLGNDVLEVLPRWSLNGSFEVLEKPTFSWGHWWEGSYQPKEEAWLNQEIGGREYLIRLRNQYYFSVFDMAMANGVSPCQNGVLLDIEYVDAFYGKDFAGNEFLTDKLERWKKVQRGLDSIGVKAFLSLAPGKGSFFEDDLSDFLRDEHKPMTNYEFIRDWSIANEIRLFDIKRVYHMWHDTSQYPLFPKGGIHWSEYGAALVCDTLRGYIQSITGRPLQKFWFDIEISDTARGADNDIADGMNLLFTPKHERLAYPIRHFGKDSTLVATNLLVIADSYYYMLMNSGFGEQVCSYGGFWFYFKDAQPKSKFASSNVDELNILEELKKQDVLMLMITEPQLKRLGWGSIERLEELLYPPKTN